MKLQVVSLLSWFSFVLVGVTYATVPDACGSESVSFDIHLRKSAPAPGIPETAKGKSF